MKNVAQIKTTLIGLVALLIPIIAAVGWMDPEKAGLLGAQAGPAIEAVFAAAGLIAGIWAIFKTNDSG